MTNDLQHIWRADDAENSFTIPESLKNRSSAFERKVRRRNLIEYAAGALIVLVSAPTAVFFLSVGMVGLGVSMALMLVGTAIVMWNLHQRASAQQRRPEEDCRSHLIAQHRRQADALRKVPLWYIGPLLPGVLGVYGTVALKAAGQVDAWEILTEIGRPLGLTLAFFAFVIWLNLRAAKALQRQAEELEQA